MIYFGTKDNILLEVVLCQIEVYIWYDALSYRIIRLLAQRIIKQLQMYLQYIAFVFITRVIILYLI